MNASKQDELDGLDQSGIYGRTHDREGPARCAPALPFQRGLQIGSSLNDGRLSLRRRIGAGGMGVVYEAYDAVRASAVALKTLNRLDGSSVYLLKNEFRALADVAHENLVGLHELFAEAGSWYFTMDLVEGVSFDRWVRPKFDDGAGCDEGRLRSALLQLFDGLGAIHAAGKLHRDLKPSNVLVTADGRLVILDFGLVSDPELGGVGRTVVEHGIAGTPEYMAPEQVDGSGVTTACDAYAAGVMLFEALTGRLPFEGNFLEVLLLKQTQPALAPSSLVPDLPADLEALCVQLLARDPRERPSIEQARARVAENSAPSVTRVRRSSAPPLAHGGALGLVGREPELTALRSAYQSARTGSKPVIVLLGGESGIGKTALAETALRELSEQGEAVILSGRCFERESVPFKGFDAVVDGLSRHLRKLPEKQVWSLLPRDTFALRRLFPVLGRIDALAEQPEREAADAKTLRQRAFAAFGELLGRIGDRQPLVLHFDDLQWSDADSTELLMHVLRQRNAPRMLVIAGHRNDRARDHPCLAPLYETLPLDTRLDVRVLELKPLSASCSAELLARGLKCVLPEVAQEAGGNPFLLGELARHAAASVDAEAGAGGLSLRTMISARVAGLPEPERALMQVLAVASRPVTLQLAAQAAELGSGSYAVFARLRSEALARGTGDGQLIECFHDKVREALLASSPQPRQAETHRALANALARAVPPDHQQIAEHLLRAGDGAAAARELVLAAEQASLTLGFDLAARQYELALAQGQFAPLEMHRLRVARANALAEAGRGVLATEAYLEALVTSSGAEAIELRQRAAEHCLLGGGLARGLALQIEALAQVGIEAPSSTPDTLASVALHSVRLRLRGLQWTAREPYDASCRQQMESLRRAAMATMRLDVLHAVDFFIRAALLALDHGSKADLARAMMGMIPASVVLAGAKDTGSIERTIAHAEQLSAEADDFETWTWLRYFRGLARTLGPLHDPESAVADFDACIESFAARALPGSSYNLGWMRWNRGWALVSMGELATVHAELPARLDEAWASSDLGLVPMWSGATGVFCMLAADEVTLARHVLSKGLHAWREPEATTQELALRDGEVMLCLYEGDARAAWDCMEDWFEKFERSPMRRSILAQQAYHYRAVAALGLAQTSVSRHEREQLHKLVADHARRIDSPLLRGALACQRRDEHSAIAELRAMSTTKAAWPVRMHEQAARRRLGVILGGDEGRGLIAGADAFFARAGVRDVERYVAMLVPGAELG